MTEPQSTPDTLLADAARFVTGELSEAEAARFAERMDRPEVSEAVVTAVRLQDRLSEPSAGPAAVSFASFGRQQAVSRRRISGWTLTAAAGLLVAVAVLVPSPVDPAIEAAVVDVAGDDETVDAFAAVWLSDDVDDVDFYEPELEVDDVPDWMLAALDDQSAEMSAPAGMETL